MPIPSNPAYILNNNLITNNLITTVAVEYVGCRWHLCRFYPIYNHQPKYDRRCSLVRNCHRMGLGPTDVGSFPGVPDATSGMWGTITAPTPNIGCKIIQNKFYNFLNILWDGGAIYTTGQQGPSLAEGLLIQGNVAYGKPMSDGGNTIYTDGGSRYIEVSQMPLITIPLELPITAPRRIQRPYYFQYPLYYLQNGLPYGSDSGGCRTYGDIDYSGNYWLQAPIPADLIIYNDIYLIAGLCPVVCDGLLRSMPLHV